VLTVPSANVSASAGQSLQLSSLFSATDADNDALTYYFVDNTTNGGHFEVNGVVKAAGAVFSVTAAQLAQTVFVAGPRGSSDHLNVQVSDGNAVSGIQSINSAWGSGVTAGDTGILLNNRMAYWHLEPGHPNRLVPGRRVRHTMNPPLVLKDGALWGVAGTPGADNQVQINFQVLTAMLDFGLDPQQAAEMPRWTSMVPGQYANYPHDGPDVLTMERRFAEARRFAAGPCRPTVPALRCAVRNDSSTPA